MNLLSNFNKFKEYFQYLGIISLADFIKFYYISVDLDQVGWKNCGRYYCSNKWLGHCSQSIDFEKYIFTCFKTGERIDYELTEEFMFEQLADLTQEDIKRGLVSSEIQGRLDEFRYLTIKSKYSGIEFNVLRNKFKKYCAFYQTYLEFSKEKLPDILVIHVDFDQNTANLVAETINRGKFDKPKDFDMLVKYIDLLRYLQVDF